MKTSSLAAKEKSSVVVVVLDVYDVLQQQHDRRSKLKKTHDEVDVAL